MTGAAAAAGAGVGTGTCALAMLAVVASIKPAAIIVH